MKEFFIVTYKDGKAMDTLHFCDADKVFEWMNNYGEHTLYSVYSAKCILDKS